jgi:single-strand DNA-binding protein
MIMNLNDCKLVGNLTRDPELRYTPKGTPVAQASVAVNENFTNGDGEKRTETTFLDVTVWGKSGENFAKLAKKGQEIFLEGSLRQQSWEDKETGQNRSKIILNSERWQFTQYRITEAARDIAKQQAQEATR